MHCHYLFYYAEQKENYIKIAGCSLCEYKYNVMGRQFAHQGDIALRQSLCKHVLSKFRQSNISSRLGTVIKNRKKDVPSLNWFQSAA